MDYLSVYLMLMLTMASTVLSGSSYGQFPKCFQGIPTLASCSYWNRKCPPGSVCNFHSGTCCKQVTYPKCTSGVIKGTCGGFVNQPCPPGYDCQYPSVGTLGRCCLRKKQELKCPSGHIKKGSCAGKMGLKCPTGQTCVTDPLVIDGLGICCAPKDRPGICPPPSPYPGICVFDLERNCLGDEFCPVGHKCCKEGCGRVCKPVLTLQSPQPQIQNDVQ